MNAICVSTKRLLISSLTLSILFNPQPAVSSQFPAQEILATRPTQQAEEKLKRTAELSAIAIQGDLLYGSLGGTVGQQYVVQLTPQMAFDQPNARFTGNAFALALTHANSETPLATPPQPITVTIHYSEQGGNAALDESTFQLMTEVAGQWHAIAAPVGATPVTGNSAHNVVTIALSQPGRYALFGTPNWFYLPFGARQ